MCDLHTCQCATDVCTADDCVTYFCDDCLRSADTCNRCGNVFCYSHIHETIWHGPHCHTCFPVINEDEQDKLLNDELIGTFYTRIKVKKMSDDEERYGNNDEEEDDDIIMLDADDLAESCKRQRTSVDQFEFEVDEDNHYDTKPVFAVPAPVTRQRNANDNHLVPFEAIPNRDVNAVRPEHAVIDAISYYNQVGLWTLMYAHVTQGIAVPAVFDAKNQKMYAFVIFRRLLVSLYIYRITTEVEFDF